MIPPFILTAKIILQELCREEVGWDDEIPCIFSRHWNEWIEELPKLVKLKGPRCFKLENFGEVKAAELHRFSDASESG